MVLESCSDFDNPPLQNSTNYRSALAAPILRDGQAVGAIAIRRREVRPFTAKDIELLKSLAERTGVEIDNAKLRMEVKERDCALAEAFEQQAATRAAGVGPRYVLALFVLLSQTSMLSGLRTSFSTPESRA